MDAASTMLLLYYQKKNFWVYEDTVIVKAIQLRNKKQEERASLWKFAIPSSQLHFLGETHAIHWLYWQFLLQAKSISESSIVVVWDWLCWLVDICPPRTLYYYIHCLCRRISLGCVHFTFRLAVWRGSASPVPTCAHKLCQIVFWLLAIQTGPIGRLFLVSGDD